VRARKSNSVRSDGSVDDAATWAGSVIDDRVSSGCVLFVAGSDSDIVYGVTT